MDERQKELQPGEMWCEHFDMDLPRVIPDARRALGGIGDMQLFTHGHKTNGKINHPSVWNGQFGTHAHFFNGHHTKPAGYYTSDPLVECTLWEALRDAWCHDFAIILNGQCIWHGGTWKHFEPLMFHVRNWRALPDLEVRRHKAAVLRMISHMAKAANRSAIPLSAAGRGVR